MIKVTILGNNSAIPAYDRHPTAQIVDVKDQLFLVDCGEGALMQMKKYGIRKSRIDHVFISHLHGDHFYGLIGFVTSIGLLGRVKPLHLYAHAPLLNIIEMQLAAANGRLPFEIIFKELLPNTAELLFDENNCQIHSFPVEHRIPCHGFKFTYATNDRKIIPEKCREYSIPKVFYKQLKKGVDYTQKNGKVIPNEWLTDPPPDPLSYAFCADTIYTDSFLSHIQEVDLLYHESTYLNKDLDRATERFHSTAEQAALIAQKAHAKKLLLGHYSSRYKDLQGFYDEAKIVFPNIEVTIEGTTYVVE